MRVVTIIGAVDFFKIYFMAETLLSIQEASSLSGKSLQTIRRAIKNKKIGAKRKKTPQGFNYMVSRDSIVAFYNLDRSLFQQHHEKGSIQQQNAADGSEHITKNDLNIMHSRMEELLDEYRKEKENFMKIFQERFLVLENQIKMLEAPSRKKWYQFWRS